MAAATETSTATSLMHAPRAAWRRIAVRGPARPAAEPGVQRGGGGEGGGISTQLQTPGRAEPPARPPSWEQPPRAAKPGASLRRARRDPPSQRRSLGRGRATAPPARCARLAGGGDGARWGTAALPSREREGICPRCCGRSRVRSGAGRCWSAAGAAAPPAGAWLPPRPGQQLAAAGGCHSGVPGVPEAATFHNFSSQGLKKNPITEGFLPQQVVAPRSLTARWAPRWGWSCRSLLQRAQRRGRPSRSLEGLHGRMTGVCIALQKTEQKKRASFILLLTN